MRTLIFVLVFLFSPYASSEVLSVKVFGLSCGACANSLEKSLKKVDGVEKVKVDLDNFQVQIETTKTVADNVLKELLLNSGYNVESIKRTP